MDRILQEVRGVPSPICPPRGEIFLGSPKQVRILEG